MPLKPCTEEFPMLPETPPPVNDNLPFLLLTAAVDARNGRDCLFSPLERRKQYLHAFRYYLRVLEHNSDLCAGIVFCENSDADLDDFRRLVSPALRRKVEFVSLSPDGFRPEKGKSWNEMRTLDLVMEESKLLSDSDLCVKLTGRYPVRNIVRLLQDLVTCKRHISVCYFRWPGGSRFGSPHPPLCDTRCIAFRKKVWKECFLGLYQTADTSKRRHFETIALDVVEKNLSDQSWVRVFSRPPLILGKQGGIKRVAGIAIPKWIEPVFLLVTYFLHGWTVRKDLRDQRRAGLR